MRGELNVYRLKSKMGKSVEQKKKKKNREKKANFLK